MLIEATNMDAVWSNYRRTGPRQLVVSGVMANRIDQQRYERAPAMPERSIRLDAGPEVTALRLQRCYGEERAWHFSGIWTATGIWRRGSARRPWTNS